MEAEGVSICQFSRLPEWAELGLCSQKRLGQIHLGSVSFKVFSFAACEKDPSKRSAFSEELDSHCKLQISLVCN